MDDLQSAEEAVSKDDSPASWTALVDVFLNLGMALTLHIALRHPRALEHFETPKVETESESTALQTIDKPAVPEAAFNADQQATIPDSQIPAKHQGPVHISGALSHSRLGLASTLDSFSVIKPEALGEQNKTPVAT